MDSSPLMMDEGAIALVYATWNPSDKSANVVLSGGDLIAMSSLGGSPRAVRATQGFVGKQYFEVSEPTAIGERLGVADSAFPLDAANLGFAANSAGVVVNGTSQAFSATGLTKTLTANTYTGGQVLGFAVNATTKEIWVQYAEGLWLDGDPVAGTSPTLSAWAAATIYAVAVMQNTGRSIELNAGASAFAYSVPSGFNPGVYT